MSREARLVVENGCYHVISRGLGKKQIFMDDSDYLKYLSFVAKFKSKFGFKLYGWSLMPTHPHLAMLSNNLSKTMHAINFSYAQYFNYKYGRAGYLFQNRFKSYLVDKDKYLLNLINYIEYNPVRAKIVSNPEDYRWSSYRARVLGNDEFGLLDTLNI